MSTGPRRGVPGVVAAATVATAAALALAAAVAERRLAHASSARHEAVRELRVELQRATLARVRLERGADELAALGTGLDDTRIAILEAADALARPSRVAVLDRALDDLSNDPYAEPSGDVRALRLTVELEAPHAVRLTEALAELARAVPGRPADVTGCRIDRADDGADAEAGSLVASCALDWFWWPS